MTRKEAKIYVAEHLLKQGELSAHEQAEHSGTRLATTTLILEELVRDGVARKHVGHTEYSYGSWRPRIRYTPAGVLELVTREQYAIAYQAGLMDKEIKFCFASLLLLHGQQSPYALAGSYGIPLATATNILEELVRDGVARKHVDGTEYRGGNERPNIRYTPAGVLELVTREQYAIAYQAGLMDKEITDYYE